VVRALEAGDTGLQVLVDLDEAVLVKANAGRFGSKCLYVGDAADGRQQVRAFRLSLAVLRAKGQPQVAASGRLNPDRGDAVKTVIPSSRRMAATSSEKSSSSIIISRGAPSMMVTSEPKLRYMMRTVPADTALGGVDIPAESTVLLLWAAGNRDSQEFEHPDEIDLSRRVPRRHVAFGRGIHHCVGAPLARIEARNVLSVLLDRTSSISLVPEHRPHWVDSLLVRRHQDLPVRLHAR